MASLRSRRALAVLIAVFLFITFARLNSGNAREYWLYFTTDRKPATLDLLSLSEEWTESRLSAEFPGFPIGCYPYQGPLRVQRACGVDVKSANGVSTLYMSFFFDQGHLSEVSINVPWWSHKKAYTYLITTLGDPLDSQPRWHAGVRLHGWKLGDGSAVFFNRDRPLNPLRWNAIYWRSASACKRDGCFIDRGSTGRLSRSDAGHSTQAIASVGRSGVTHPSSALAAAHTLRHANYGELK